MKSIFSRCTFGLFFAFAVVELSAETLTPSVLVNGNHTNGIYSPGETVTWRVDVHDASTNALQASYSVKQGGLTKISDGKLSLTNGVTEISSKLDEPGTLLLEIKVPLSDGKRTNYFGGAAIAPEKIKRSAPRPDDFDQFWDAKLKELAAVPANPKLTPGESDRPAADYWQITMDNIRGTHIRGQLARPKTEGKYPAMLVVMAAGVSGLKNSSVTKAASKGWLAMNILAHDLPIDESPEFYQKQIDGPLKEYWMIGKEDRETSYFLRMYLSCYRAVQYLSERPDWDGKTLLVTGVSQGGLQTLMTAGFHPKVTVAIADVPAGCDLTGSQVGRNPGWPVRLWKMKNEESEKSLAAARYYDVANFATRIRCPVLVGIGLVDDVCPPAGIYAALNQLKGPKEIVLMPRAGHLSENDAHQAYKDRNAAWMTALLAGKSVPPKP